MDFYKIRVKKVKGEDLQIMYPDFIVGRSKDLMVRGRAFYAIWDEAAGLWSTDEYDVQRLVDQEMLAYAAELEEKTGEKYNIKLLSSFTSTSWSQFRKYVSIISDNSHDLDCDLTFADQVVSKSDYRSRRLPYALVDGPCPAWDELVGTLYSIDERAKIEWIIGAIMAGDAKKIDKFGVFYGDPGSGKGTILKIVKKLCSGYTTAFDAKALGNSNNAFATEAFKSNPLVAIQEDADLSKIESNEKLNMIISHEDMPMNEKFKPVYTSWIRAFLLIGTNEPVKISGSKSGIPRRLIDIHPTGVRILENHYFTLFGQIDFELGAIAQRCLNVYRSMGKNFYSKYKPLEMMLQSDVTFNFIEAHFDIFKEQDGTSLKQAFDLYKEWCDYTGITYGKLPQYKLRTELESYFEDFKERAVIDGQHVRSYYSGFKASKFKQPAQEPNVFSLVIEETESLFDELAASWPAQGSRVDQFGAEIPSKKWVNVETVLSDIDTHDLHYVKIPEEYIVIDFDLKDESGEKSLERNLEAASVWPPTYAELSKSGAGVHLLYRYEGDVSQLASHFSDGIEVKTLLGDASLRRRLSKCNRIPVATINSGLPLKEKKKVLSAETIQSERGLREMIARNMKKEFHPSTKSSIDFIDHILTQCYNEGLAYDISDMRSAILAFAMNSTNQHEYCFAKVLKMRFMGKGVDAFVEQPAVEKTDEPIAFYDVEVYQNLFIIVWKFAGGNHVKMINPTPQDVEALFKLKLVGFYNRRYDNHILWARYMGYDNQALFELSQKIVSNYGPGVYFPSAYDISYADIYDFASKKQTLKKWELEIGAKHMELDIPWDQPVPEEKWERVIEYCCNDVDATEALFFHLSGDFKARQILAELSGLSVNDKTDKHVARILFGNDRDAYRDFEYTDLSKDFPGYDFDAGKSHYRGFDPSEGGFVYAEPGMYENVVVLDVASMHPTSIEQLNYFGPYTPRFAALREARLAIKAGDYEAARNMFDGKLERYLENENDAEALSYALKIVINIVYGLTSAKFDNPFRQIKNKDNIVAKRGALFMIDLLLACQEKGLQVVHIKTDSIKIPNATPEDIEEIMAFGKKWGYDFEHEATYDRFCLVNDAVYIARYGWAAKERLIGKWDAVGLEFQRPFVFKKLFSGEPIEFEDLIEAKSVQKGALYLDHDFDRPEVMVERMTFIGKTGAFVPIKEGHGGGILYRTSDDPNKVHSVSGTKGYLWTIPEVAMKLGLEAIDMSYFETLADKARQKISEYGDADWFGVLS